MKTINPLWSGTTEADLASKLVAANPATARAEMDRILADVRSATYSAVDPQFASRAAAGYDDAWDAEFQRLLRSRIDAMSN